MTALCVCVQMREHTRWITKARQLLGDRDQAPPPPLDEFKKVRDEGLGLVNTIEIDRIATMTDPLELEDDDEPLHDYDESADFRMAGWHALIQNLATLDQQLARIIADGDAMQKKADDILQAT